MTTTSERTVAAERMAAASAPRYVQITDAIERVIVALNDALHLNADDRHRVTFGYIGNCDLPRFDDRRWMIFLPHPGRVGREDDSIGSWRTGDADGAAAALAQLSGALRLARWQSDPFVAAALQNQRDARAAIERAARRVECLAYAAAHGIDWTPSR